MNFTLTQKPIGDREMRLARISKLPTSTAGDFDREMSSLCELLERAKAGDVDPLTMEHGLTNLVLKTQQAFHGTEPSYRDDHRIKTLKSVIEDVTKVLSGAEEVQATKLETWKADRQEVIDRLGDKVSRNIKQAFERGLGKGATIGDKADGGVYSWKDVGQAKEYLQSGFALTAGRSGSAGRYGHADLSTDIRVLLENLTTVADDGVRKWTGFSDIGRDLGSVLAQVAEMEGEKFTRGAELLQSYTEPTGLIYGQIQKAGRDLGKEFAKTKASRAEEIRDLGKGLGLQPSI